MDIWMNLGSILLGLTAWALPLASLARGGQGRENLSCMSFGACALASFLQICAYNHLVMRGDWSALADTSESVAFAAALLLAVTLLLNALSCFKRRARTGSIPE